MSSQNKKLRGNHPIFASYFFDIDKAGGIKATSICNTHEKDIHILGKKLPMTALMDIIANENELAQDTDHIRWEPSR